VRSHAKAPEPSTRHTRRSDRRADAQRGVSGRGDGRGAPAGRLTACLAVALLASLVALLLGAGTALAGTVSNERPILFKFDVGTAGILSFPGAIAVDEASGDLYVVDRGSNSTIDKFEADGTPANFSSTGSHSLGEHFGHIAVDNSGGATQGRIYVASGTAVEAFNPAGEYLWTLEPPFGKATAAAVDSAGHLWVSDAGSHEAIEFANTGSPPAQVAQVPITTGTPASLGIDGAGDLFVNRSGRVDKYVGGAYETSFDSGSQDLAVDQPGAAGHVFSAHYNDFSEFEPDGTLFGSYTGEGFMYLTGGIAYNSALDRVYLTNGYGEAQAFGHRASGTVPDAAATPPSSPGISSATFTGTVNPRSVPSSYHFEWKHNEFGSFWGPSEWSTPQSLPTDEEEHAASFEAHHLLGNTTYMLRLVGVNAENHLRGSSSVVEFTTATPAAPTASIQPVSAIATESAHLEGAVNPQGDYGAGWKVELSTDPECASGFHAAASGSLHSEATSEVPVSADLTGLLPSQRYCARVVGENAGGTAISAVETFTTAPIAPEEAETIPAAPRHTTSARLNARVNPNGETLVYRFEYSADGGATWTVLADEEDTSEVREQTVVGEEVGGLSPDTTYVYRFSGENPAGEVQGGEMRFATRQAGEEELVAPRGLELVNNPDKGNQDAKPVSSLGVSADGSTVGWQVSAGAPGGNSGAFSAFLATRTSSGWRSEGLAPPAEDQYGSGSIPYFLMFASPDRSHFLFGIYQGILAGGEIAVARVDREHRQELLEDFPDGTNQEVVTRSWDFTDDLSQAFTGAYPFGRLYAYTGPGEREEVGLMNDGEPPACGIPPDGFRRNGAYAPHWVATTDGSRVFFRSQGDNCSGPYGLYVRNRETATTTQIAAEAEFIQATPDGRSALFDTREQLTAEDVNSEDDLYRWKEGEGAECLTCTVGGARYYDGLTSEDLSFTYFRSFRQLAPGSSAGHPNLYVLHDGTIRLVSPVADIEMTPTWSRLSANGHVLVFASGGSPTADRVANECALSAGGIGGIECHEYYRYDYSNGSLECLSCVRGGVTRFSAPPNSLALSADGSTAAFTTEAALDPMDVNRELDVYEWHNGARRLVTDGVHEWGNSFASKPTVDSASADGSDIVFTVASQKPLTGFEQDGLANMYDARVGGGFTPPNPPAHCVEESCQGPLAAAPARPEAASAGFAGHGNEHTAVASCRVFARRAAILARRARSLRHRATRAPKRKTRRLRRRAAHAARRARRMNRHKRRCRRARRRSEG